METDNLILRSVVVSCRWRARSHPCSDTRWQMRSERSLQVRGFHFQEEIIVQMVVIVGDFICGLFGEWNLVNLTKLAVCQTSYQIIAFCRGEEKKTNKQDSAR